MWRLHRGFCRDARFERETGVVAAVASRTWGDTGGARRLGRALKALGLSSGSWAAAEQVHGRIVRRVLKPSAPARLPAADGLLTDEKGLALTIRTADCAAVFLADKARGAAALIHAGWRGADHKILTAALQKMIKYFGSNARDIQMAVGPHIRECCYEVGEDVARRFPGAVNNRGGRFYLSLAEALKREAVLAGISRRRISVSSHCTAHGGGFFSYRRNKTKKRQTAIMAVINRKK